MPEGVKAHYPARPIAATARVFRLSIKPDQIGTQAELHRQRLRRRAIVAVEFFFDFGSPNAYLAHKVIPAIEARTGEKFTHVPVLLGGIFKATGNQSPMMAFAGIPAKLAYEQMEMRRFISRHGLNRFQLNPHFPVNTLPIMRGAIAAQELGVFDTYVESVFADMWERGLKMDAPDVIAAALQKAGLPAGALGALMQADGVKTRLAENTSAAVEKGVFGSPSFLVDGDALYFGKDRLRDVEEEMLRRKG
ncbi:2-hydroxychromene-2-carboxylate isomerase [Altererythrobacter confluentis]|uniref:2-hydroxychromene-2-carboxylate isomerase n=1 Tax=Allopontixanthobacter confluentis TaxID=1849021 RepID=A0A6L7GFA0_9SPHN|nr:2-hydroxychromene-2-carboxylate isomerase [Allopontixanthobacter confluentis]MXP14146.1 2-hydroxychromene-2-carboxylate isomerase [Allopontixanthobacter confluentis]